MNIFKKIKNFFQILDLENFRKYHRIKIVNMLYTKIRGS